MSPMVKNKVRKAGIPGSRSSGSELRESLLSLLREVLSSSCRESPMELVLEYLWGAETEVSVANATLTRRGEREIISVLESNGKPTKEEVKKTVCRTSLKQRGWQLGVSHFHRVTGAVACVYNPSSRKLSGACLLDCRLAESASQASEKLCLKGNRVERNWGKHES